MFICYQWVCDVNGKKYIGVTKKTLEGRWQEHCGSARRGSCQLFHKAIRKYGKDSFSGSKLASTQQKDEALRFEKQFIEEYNTLAGSGYNLTTGGEYPQISDKLRKYLSEKALKRKPVTDETRLRLSNSLKGNTNKKGKLLSSRTKKLISESMTGRVQSEETKKKRSGKNHWNATRVCVEGVMYDTIKEAAISCNVALSTMYYRVRSVKFSEYTTTGSLP